MAEQQGAPLGQMPRPAAEEFRQGRRLLQVPFPPAPPQSPEDYTSRLRTYWEEVDGQVRNLELRLGRLARIYHEGVFEEGDRGMEFLERFNGESARMVRIWCAAGAVLERTEEAALVQEMLDWERCLVQPLFSEKVVNHISQQYQEAAKRRYEHIAQRIQESLKAQETGMLIMDERHRFQFPPDIQIFYVSPPSLDGLRRRLQQKA